MDVLQKGIMVLNAFNERYFQRYHNEIGEYTEVSMLYDDLYEHDVVVDIFFQPENSEGYYLHTWLDEGTNELHIINDNREDMYLFAKENGWTKGDVYFMRFGAFEIDVSEIRLLSFNVNNLSDYTNSLLFDSTSISGESIASATFSYMGVEHSVYLDICGDVSITFKDVNYKIPSKFPEELINRIKAHPNDFDVYAPSGEGNDCCEGDIFVWNNNWFEYLEDNSTDGIIYEDDLSKATPDEILADMTDIAKKWYQDHMPTVLSA